MFEILVIDDDLMVQVLLERTFKKQGYAVTVASNGEEGLVKARQLQPALIICDWMMPRLNGIEVCRQVKSEPDLSTTFFILLTSLDSVADRVNGLDAGADDFISKPIEMNELQARVRAGLRLHQLALDLQTQKEIMEAEFSEAAEYVRSLLPDPLTKIVKTDARFIPSSRLGGDGFDYFWLDHDSLAIYLLDVAGHGLKAALPSISVLNLLRSRSLRNINYHQPSDVLRALNQTFQTSVRNDTYFTIWYGVYHRHKKQLVYASAGHPPAVLLSKNAKAAKRLKTPCLAVGMFPDTNFVEDTCHVETGSTLYVFSDGIYELHQPDGNVWGLDAFINLLVEFSQQNKCNLAEILQFVQIKNGKEFFDDDLSLLEVNFI